MKTPLISVKIFKIIGSAIFLIVIIHTYLNQSLTENFISKQIYLRGISLSYPLHDKVQATLNILDDPNSLYGLSIICKRIKDSAPDILEVCLLDKNGRVLAHDNGKKIGDQFGNMPQIGDSRKIKNLQQNEIAAINAYSLVFHPKLPDPLLIKVSISKKQLKKESDRALTASILFMVVVLPVFLGIVYFFTNIIIGKRIAQMVQGFQTLAAGRFNIRLNGKENETVNEKNRDEINFLMDSFDKMAQQLEDFDYRRKKQEKQLAFLANHDQLTTLPNRRLLEKTMEKAIARAGRGHLSVFMLMDLDNFKFINDTYGHSIGDQVLIDVTALLQRMLRSTDFLARLGGDEFALLLEDVNNVKEAQLIADRMNQALGEYHSDNENHNFSISFSIGITEVDGRATPEILLSQADAAMYTAKKMGRNRAIIFRAGTEAQFAISRVNEWATRIKDALKNDHFILFFQPIIKLKETTVDYYEVLLRLKNEMGELFAPGDFIPAAEQFGLMPQIDRLVFKKVIHELMEKPSLKLFMNISAYSLADNELLDYFAKKIVEHQIEPGRLGFEFAEASVLKEMNHAERWMRILNHLGCPLALDDFGLSFNSMLYLQRLPINQLKLDGFFIQSLDSEFSQDAFVKAMHHLAKELGMETVAEFVENEKVLNILKQIGVTYGQGYHLGKPASQYIIE